MLYVDDLFLQIAQMGDKRFENPQTANLQQILADTIAIHELMLEKERGPPTEEEGAQRRPKSTLVSDFPFGTIKGMPATLGYPIPASRPSRTRFLDELSCAMASNALTYM